MKVHCVVPSLWIKRIGASDGHDGQSTERESYCSNRAKVGSTYDDWLKGATAYRANNLGPMLVNPGFASVDLPEELRKFFGLFSIQTSRHWNAGSNLPSGQGTNEAMECPTTCWNLQSGSGWVMGNLP
jgi:hypothetical protein